MRACSRSRTPTMTWSIPAIPLAIASPRQLPIDLTTEARRTRWTLCREGHPKNREGRRDAGPLAFTRRILSAGLRRLFPAGDHGQSAPPAPLRPADRLGRAVRRLFARERARGGQNRPTGP